MSPTGRAPTFQYPDDRLDAESLDRLEPIKTLAGRNATKADVMVYDLGDRLAAVKSYEPRPWWIRSTLGRILTRREAGAFTAARGLPGLPRFLGRIGPCALATEWVEARPLATVEPATLDRDVFDRLDAILVGLHSRGIALSDLHHRDVLLDDHGQVFLVDLATALVAGPRPSALRRWLFGRLCDQDRVAAARMRARWSGADEDMAVATIGAGAQRWYRRGRRVKVFWDRLRGKRH